MPQRWQVYDDHRSPLVGIGQRRGQFQQFAVERTECTNGGVGHHERFCELSRKALLQHQVVEACYPPILRPDTLVLVVSCEPLQDPVPMLTQHSDRIVYFLFEVGQVGKAVHEHLVIPISDEHNRRINQLHRRGRSAARSEWRLITATHNLMKLHKHHLAAQAA